MNLTPDEEALYEELVVQIAARYPKDSFDGLVREENLNRTDRFDIKGCFIGHGAQSDFEGACRILHGLGALIPLKADGSVSDDGRVVSSYFRVTLDVEELRSHLGQGLPPDAPSLSFVIQVFLRLFTDYGCEIPTCRKPFTEPPGFQRSFALFARCGYVGRVDDKVFWTGRIAPEMLAIYAWDDEGVSAEERLEAEAEAMWRTLPAVIRQTFFSRDPGDTVDLLSLSIVISRFWNGDRWLPIVPQDEDAWVTILPDSTEKARALVERHQLSMV